jgi:hypothetical protein
VSLAPFIEKSDTTLIELEVPEDRIDALAFTPGTNISIHAYYGPGREGVPGSHGFLEDDPQHEVQGPHGFLVEEPRGYTNRPHFHSVDQFNVILPNAGTWFMRQDVDRVLVQYTDAFTTYGPFGSHGPDPLRFFTFRGAPAKVTGYMPGDRDKLVVRGMRRHAEPIGRQLGQVPASGTVEVTQIIEQEADGLQALLLSVGPDTKVPQVPEVDGSPGQFFCVLTGSVRCDAKEYGSESMGWRATSTAAPASVAGREGCDLLVLQLPVPTISQAVD